MGSEELAFLQRHGGDAAIPPHRINYRANLWALRELGVREIIAINAVGGISDGMRPGRLVIPDQLIDYTWGRAHTIDEGGADGLMHIDFTEPYDRRLRAALIQVATAEGIAHSAGGVYAATQGPRLETAAEVRRLAGDGCDVVGMTGMPEAALARELGLAYVSLCMVVNPAPGLADEPLTLAGMRDALAREAATVHRLLAAFIAAR
jgi:5'-methylthioinosine phosphorylase